MISMRLRTRISERESDSKVVLVTGALGAIGSATSLLLIQKGFKVIGTDRKAQTLVNKNIDFVRRDLRNLREIMKLVKYINSRYKKLYGIVFCTGIYPIMGFDKYTYNLWREVHMVNLDAAFLLIKGLVHKSLKQGRIILVSSGAAHLGSNDVGYASSKAGLVGLAKGLAKQLSKHSIQVNAICPGVIESLMSNRMAPEIKGKYIKETSLGRIGMPQEVAIAIHFLLDEKNTYMSGATIDVNGGLYMR